jgi:hypothetical protein
MLRFAEVKEIVRLIVRFVLSLAAALILLVAGIVAVRWVTYLAPGDAVAGRTLAILVAEGVRPAVLPAVVIAALSCLFGLLRVSAARPVGLPVVLLLTGFSITFGMIGLDKLPVLIPSSSSSLVHRIEPNVIYRSEAFDFYAFGRRGLELETVVVHDDGTSPAFGVVAEGIHDRQTDTLLLPGEADRSLPLSRVDNAYWEGLHPPPQVSRLFSHVSSASDAFRDEFRPGTTDFLILSWSLALLLTSLWAVVRISRWPLLNILLALGMARLVFAVFALVRRDMVREFAGLLLPEDQLHYLLPGAFAAAALVLLLILVLLPPYRDWKRGLGSV